MSVALEAIGLPVMFLTVLLLGALKIADTIVLVPPSPFALVLGALLLRLLVQSGVLAPERLLSPSRTALANVNGLVVLVTLWAAAAQTIAVLIPDSGVPQIAVNVFFFILLLNTAAAAPDRRQLLRSLAVTLGALFVVKFVILHQLSAPGAGSLKRALQAVLDVVTVGALIQDVAPPVVAYVALLAVILFLGGLVLLPHRAGSRRPALPPVSLPEPSS
jgi:hypothetical protein